jgi:hypothetical protein
MGQRIGEIREVRLRSLYRIWQRDTTLGGPALYNNTTDNIALGESAVANRTRGDNNIYLGNVVQAGDPGNAQPTVTLSDGRMQALTPAP